MLEIEPIDPADLRARDETQDLGRRGPLQFAEAVDVQVTPSTYGTWHRLADGSRLWRLRISAPGATDLGFGFTRYWLPKGATLHLVSEADGYVEGPYDARDNAEHGELWTPVIPGSNGVIELYLPVLVTAEPELVLGRIGRGYRDLFSRHGEPSKNHGACHNDVVCPEGDPWRDEIRSVAAFGIGAEIFCTGTLIMDVPRSFTPWFLTAAHCGVTADNDQTVVVYWNYEAPSCGQQDGGPLTDNQTGTIWRASRADNDMALVELEETPSSASNVYYAGWDARASTRPGGSVGIHHPEGHVKSISFNNDALTITPDCTMAGGPSDSHWGVDNWEDGVTAPGSSGSGLWDSGSHLLVGYLTGGGSQCSDMSQGDCYGRMAIGWNGSTASERLRDWLDPSGTGTQTVAGSNPGGGGGGGSALTSGVPVSGSVAAGAWDYYTMMVPSGATRLNVATSGTSGDIDLYLRYGAAPNSNEYDYRPFTSSGDEAIEVTPSSTPQPLVSGTWHIGINGYEASSYSLVATVTDGGGGGGGGAFSYLVAGQAHAPGALGSNWRSKLAILNRSGSQASVSVTFMQAKSQAKVNLSFGNGQLRAWDDVLVDLFGTGDSAAGAIKVDSDRPLVVTSRTYNQAGTGTFGQFLPGVPSTQAVAAGGLGAISQLTQNSSFRTNVGFVNLTSVSCSAVLTFYGPGGGQVGSAATYNVPAHGWYQKSEPMISQGAGTQANAYALVQVQGSGCQLWGYASVVDNATGDPTTVPMAVLE